MTVYTASSAAALTSALTSAHAGDTIKLSAGNYGNVSISDTNFAGDVTIVSADPTHAAVFSSLSIVDSSDIHLDHINIAYTPTAATMSWSSAVMIDSSHGITISGSVMTGGPAVNGVSQTAKAGDATDNVKGLWAARAVTITNAADVTISGSAISHFDRGMVLNHATATIIDGNNIHDLRRTAIAGTGDHLTIANNNLHDAHPWKWGDTAGQGDHADFIALFTDASRPGASSNIVITNNVMAQGTGAPILGMWLQGGNGGFSNVTISGNAIEVGNNQGITLSDVTGGVISHNILLEPTGAAQAPLITLQAGVSGVAVSGNLVSSVVDQNSGYTGNISQANTVIQSTNSTATGYYNATLLSKVVGLTAADVYTIIQQGVTVVADTTPAAPDVTAQSLLNPGGVPGKALIGDYHDNALMGGSGNDTLVGNNGADTLTGGAGNDIYVVPNSTGRIVESASGGSDTVIAKGDHALEANVENLVINNDAGGGGWSGIGNTLDNVVVGNNSGNFIDGGAGNDTLDGGLGNDQVVGGAGNDMLLGGGGRDSLTGGLGADTFVIGKAFGTERVLDFSQSQGDTVTVVGSTYTASQVGADTVVKLPGGDKITLDGVTLSSLKAGWISQVGSLFGVTATTPEPEPAGSGGAAGQSLMGSYRDEVLTGGAGDDTIAGAGGSDVLRGGAGNDTYVVPNADASIVENAGSGVDTVIAKGNHVLEANVENLVIDNDKGSNWNGTGNALNNVIIGNALRNYIEGLDGNDTLDGGLGNDQILGGNGNDVLLGSGGFDTLTGGAGADTFRMVRGFGSDTVTDFSYAAGDRISVADSHYTTAQVGANTVINLSSGDQMVLTNVNLASLHAGWIVVT